MLTVADSILKFADGFQQLDDSATAVRGRCYSRVFVYTTAAEEKEIPRDCSTRTKASSDFWKCDCSKKICVQLFESNHRSFYATIIVCCITFSILLKRLVLFSYSSIE